ncbi:hypothetical protein BGZ68_003121, partial [Mortierella alpina]
IGGVRPIKVGLQPSSESTTRDPEHMREPTWVARTHHKKVEHAVQHEPVPRELTAPVNEHGGSGRIERDPKSCRKPTRVPRKHQKKNVKRAVQPGLILPEDEDELRHFPTPDTNEEDEIEPYPIEDPEERDRREPTGVPRKYQKKDVKRAVQPGLILPEDEDKLRHVPTPDTDEEEPYPIEDPEEREPISTGVYLAELIGASRDGAGRAHRRAL